MLWGIGLWVMEEGSGSNRWSVGVAGSTSRPITTVKLDTSCEGIGRKRREIFRERSLNHAFSFSFFIFDYPGGFFFVCEFFFILFLSN